MAALYTDYTAEQTGTIEFLISEGKKINQKIQELLRFEAYDQTEVDKLNNKLDDIRNNLDEALNAKSRFKFHLEEARKHLEEADRLSKKYGVK